MAKHSNALAVDLFTAEECEQILALKDTLEFKPAGVVRPSGPGRSLNRVCTTAVVPRDEDNEWIYQRILDKAYELNKDVWQFDMSNIEQISMVSYGFMNRFGMHMDSGIPVVSKRKVSVSVQLSKPSDYLYGLLYVRGRNKDARWAPKTQGSAMFFPSHLWHAVKPVLWGRRYCLVAWITGDKPLR